MAMHSEIERPQDMRAITFRYLQNIVRRICLLCLAFLFVMTTRTHAVEPPVSKVSGGLDIAYGNGKIKFPNWPELETFDQGYACRNAFMNWQQALALSPTAITDTQGFDKPTGNWGRFDAACEVFDKTIENVFQKLEPPADEVATKFHEAVDALTATFDKERAQLTQEHEKQRHALDVQHGREWEHFPMSKIHSPEWHALVTQQDNELKHLTELHRQEDQAMQVRYFEQELALARPAYVSLLTKWKALRDEICFECQDFYDVCSVWIGAIMIMEERENWSMNCVRASHIADPISRLPLYHPAYAGIGGLWAPGGPLTQEELEKMLLKPSAPVADKPLWVIPSTTYSLPSLEPPKKPGKKSAKSGGG